MATPVLDSVSGVASPLVLFVAVGWVLPSSNTRSVGSGCTRSAAESPVGLRIVCPRRLGVARPIDGRPVTQVYVDGAMLDVIADFIYLGDDLDAGGGCELAIATRSRNHPERARLKPTARSAPPAKRKLTRATASPTPPSPTNKVPPPHPMASPCPPCAKLLQMKRRPPSRFKASIQTRPPDPPHHSPSVCHPRHASTEGCVQGH